MSSAKQLTPILMAVCLSITSTTIDMAGATTVSVQAFTSNSIDDRTIPPGTTPPTKLPAPLFTYMKQSDTSILKVTYQDAIWSSSPGAPVCEYQLRLDDTSSEPGNRFSAPILVVSGGIYGTKFEILGVKSCTVLLIVLIPKSTVKLSVADGSIRLSYGRVSRRRI